MRVCGILVTFDTLLSQVLGLSTGNGTCDFKYQTLPLFLNNVEKLGVASGDKTTYNCSSVQLEQLMVGEGGGTTTAHRRREVPQRGTSPDAIYLGSEKLSLSPSIVHGYDNEGATPQGDHFVEVPPDQCPSRCAHPLNVDVYLPCARSPRQQTP